MITFSGQATGASWARASPGATISRANPVKYEEERALYPEDSKEFVSVIVKQGMKQRFKVSCSPTQAPSYTLSPSKPAERANSSKEAEPDQDVLNRNNAVVVEVAAWTVVTAKQIQER